jgi:hypothetical protein
MDVTHQVEQQRKSAPGTRSSNLVPARTDQRDIIRRILRGPPPVVQRKCNACEEEGEPPILRTEGGTGVSIAEGVVVEARRALSTSVGASLPPAVAAILGRAYDHDLSNARLHTGGTAGRTTKDLGARAFSIGSDVYMGAGEYAPGTAAGNELLAHELAHVVQYERSQATGTPLQPGVSKRSESVEQEASTMASSGNQSNPHGRDPHPRRRDR